MWQILEETRIAIAVVSYRETLDEVGGEGMSSRHRQRARPGVTDSHVWGRQHMHPGTYMQGALHVRRAARLREKDG